MSFKRKAEEDIRPFYCSTLDSVESKSQQYVFFKSSYASGFLDATPKVSFQTQARR